MAVEALLLGLLLSVSIRGAAHAQQVSSAPAAGGVIDRILIERKNVFNPAVPGEDWPPFLLADRIHKITREYVVKREVLLRPGEAWDPLKGLETERNLRALGFIRRAEVSPIPSAEAPGKLDLRVRTQDSWTLAPQFSAGTEGGDTYLVYGIEEGNLLGMGKSVGVFHSQLGPEIRNEARYSDPRLAGTWFKMTDLYATTPHGNQAGALFERPFFSLDTDYSARLVLARLIEQDILYQDAQQTTKFIQNYHTAALDGGARVSHDPDFVQRLHAGYYYARSGFESIDGTAPDTLPAGRTLSGPQTGYSWVHPRYIKEMDIDKMKRVEDYDLGNEFSLSAGPSLAALGADRDRWLFNVLDQQGLEMAEGRFLLGQAGAQGRVAAGAWEDAVFFANLNLFWKALWPVSQTFVSHAEINTTSRLDAENQLILGGNTGLRGYRNYSFTGGRSALLNFEDRLFYDPQLFHLVYAGAAAFFDTGAMVGPTSPLLARDFKSDVGIGLRFSPSRSTSGSVLRVDLAYALNSGPGGSRWVVSIRGGQAFNIFNSTDRRALRGPDAALEGDSPDARTR